MTAKFDFSDLEVRSDRPIEYKVRDVLAPSGAMHPKTGQPMRHPVLLVTPATEANGPYWTEELKRAAQRDSRDEAEDIILSREDDIVLFPKHGVVCGWYGVVDVEGNDVPFSVEDCSAYLRALPSYAFGRLRMYVRQARNFIAEKQPTPGQIEAQGNG